MGYYESEIFRAARLVVDSGLHYFNWTRSQAIDFFMKYTAETFEGIEVEVDRYITWPGQATAYKVGELCIRALRQKAEKELGKYFDVREFHMAVLENGALPLPILENQVNKWIKEFRKRKLEEEEMEDEECQCIVLPRAKPRVQCKRSAAPRSKRNRATRLFNVAWMWLVLLSSVVVVLVVGGGVNV
ncbi:hypothetical protein ElyMa_000395800 [Elysia marginata]|uniref:Uncharacterized protein n=1 Tax=Elysia marginata TaxID=1093978 RepID=A0AAV4FL30_9GAST|nr:hypothetical protein ElyMa_000395800 [Elysia marginata]